MAIRFSSGNEALPELIRRRQDLTNQWQALDKRLIAAVSAPPDKRDAAGVARIRQESASVEHEIADSDAQLAKDFPEYAELTRPKPLFIADVQKLLKDDEALVVFLPSENETFVWVVAKDALAWQRVPFGNNALSGKLAALRSGLDRKACLAHFEDDRNRCDDVGALPFDLSLAHDLYKTLLGPVETAIKDKKHLVIVPSGTLTSLPFNVLVTDLPERGPTSPEAYAKAQWLIRSHALTVLPSVSSLRALRVFAKTSAASKPFIGFGDALFQKAPESKPQQLASNESERGLSAYFRGALGDISILHRLPELPETAEELVAISNSIGGSGSKVILGPGATETKVKALSAEGDLAHYRIVDFATHGLVAGDIKGLAEPGLVLTLPDAPTETDDGILTASEVAQLKLDADWVVLSACNTAAGDKPGAEALSGLAKAFFYAGTRALLVSHWPVESQSAEFLTTHTFKAMRDAETAGKPIGRAEALRRAELASIADPNNAHPALWAPFMLVGEGGVANGSVAGAPYEAHDSVPYVPPPMQSATRKSAALQRPPGVTHAAVNDAFARAVVRTLQTAMPDLQDVLGQATVKIVLSEKGDVIAATLTKKSLEAEINDRVLSAAKLAVYPIPPRGSRVVDRTFIITYIYDHPAAAANVTQSAASAKPSGRSSSAAPSLNPLPDKDSKDCAVSKDASRRIAACASHLLKHQSDSIAYYSQGTAYEEKGQRDAALHAYDNAIRLEPSSAAVTARRALLSRPDTSAAASLQPLSQDDEEMLKKAIKDKMNACWRSPSRDSNKSGADLPVVRLRWMLKRDGKLDGDIRVTSAPNTYAGGLYAQAAIDAVKCAAPFKLPTEQYATWKIIDWTFDPKNGPTADTHHDEHDSVLQAPAIESNDGKAVLTAARDGKLSHVASTDPFEGEWGPNPRCDDNWGKVIIHNQSVLITRPAFPRDDRRTCEVKSRTASTGIPTLTLDCDGQEKVLRIYQGELLGPFEGWSGHGYFKCH